MGVTIYDLAREAGVGIGTVSRCLNNHPSVSPQTRERVMSIVRRLSYQPHTYAQRLASKRTNTVSAIIPFFTNYFFVEVLRGVQDRALESGIDLVLYGVNNAAQAEYYLRRSLSRGYVDGVMFFSMKFPDAFVAKFHQTSLPVVLVDAHHAEFDSITEKNREGAEEAVQHLIDLGHRDVAMINGSLDSRPARERLAGYKSALERNGIRFRDEMVYFPGASRLDGFTRESGRSLMMNLLDRRRPGKDVTAAFIASDIQAIGGIEAARERHLRVPEDIAVVGFDDIELAQHVQLSTMRQPMNEM
jgi:LacI family transcriptional regulator